MNPENQFDFWLGEWDAAWGEDGKGYKPRRTNPGWKSRSGRFQRARICTGSVSRSMILNVNYGARPGWITMVRILISRVPWKTGK